MPPKGFEGEAGQPSGGLPSASGGEGGAAAGARAASAAAGSEHSELGGAGDSGDAGASEEGGAPSGGSMSHAGAPHGGHAGSLATGGTAGALAVGGADAAGAGGTSGTVGVAGGVESGGSVGVAGAPSAGSAGAPSVLACADYPFSVKTAWVATASHQSITPKNVPQALVDGTNARWSSGKAQSGDEWIQVDFGATVSLRSINLQQGSDTNDYPRSYAVIVSDTKNDLTGVVRASGIGTSGVTTTISLPKVTAGRYLLMKQLGSSLSWWSVAEVEPSCVDG